MMLVNLKHMGKSIGIRFPASTDEVNRASIELKRPYDAPQPRSDHRHGQPHQQSHTVHQMRRSRK